MPKETFDYIRLDLAGVGMFLAAARANTTLTTFTQMTELCVCASKKIPCLGTHLSNRNIGSYWGAEGGGQHASCVGVKARSQSSP